MSRPIPRIWSCLRSTASTRSQFHPPAAARCRNLSTNGTGSNSKLRRKMEFQTTQKRTYKTVQEQRSRYRSGPFSLLAGTLFLSSGLGLVLYFRHEKSRMERRRVAEASKGVGRPKVGGPFSLLTQEGKPFSEQEMRGRWSLVYFGFSHCPDICPEELDKMAVIIDRVNEGMNGEGDEGKLLPIFVTCDPARDTPAVLKEYLKEFHEEIVGLTGSWEEVKDMCKKYRVYFSTPEKTEGKDYLVDHSIYFYLMDPDGDFVEAIGRQMGPEEAARCVLGWVGDWGK
ncbi:protein sco1 [Mollisia scopiformis]|uniref:Protein sco1 n=1 Tax=Mollisia scopiformis TaxID=149040 RepID=A0A194X1D0_MOLSC|nr:protein sco1 [Mollisia scopiformis]KUJ13998.1 protein sco1 [Mollisia scopiformis]